MKNRRYFKPVGKLTYPSSGNYEVIRPNRFSNGLINAKDEIPSNRLNLIEHNLHNYATSASNPTINKFKYNLKSLLPKMDKNVVRPYGGINIEALENQKDKLHVQKIFIKDTINQRNPNREIRDLKNRETPLSNKDQLIQLEASKQGEQPSENEIYEPFNSISNRTKVIFTTDNQLNLTSELRKIDLPISFQSESAIYGSRINKLQNRTIPFAETGVASSNHNSTTRKPFKIKKMYVNRGSLNKNLLKQKLTNETEAEENRFRFVHVPASIIIDSNKENRLIENDEYKNENYLIDKKETFNLLNDQESKSTNNIAKYEIIKDNLIELANQKQIIKAFPLGRVAKIDDNLNVESSQLTAQYLSHQTTVYPLSNLTNFASSIN